MYYKNEPISLDPKIISFELEFKNFWPQAKNKPFEKQVELWNTFVEGPHQEFFDYFVWSNVKTGDFSERRLKQLKSVFRRIGENEEKVIRDLQEFEATMGAQIARYRITFSDANFPVNCFAVIGGNFVGRAGATPKTNQKVLAFGIEKMADMNVNADNIYSHELFHIYHGIKSDIDQDDRMIAQLWAEWLASFVSHELNPDSTKKDIFLYPSTAEIKDDQRSRLGALFLEVANKNEEGIYFNWFLSEEEVENNLPAMAGYWLGYKVVEELRAQYSLDEMAQWPIEKAERVVTSVLKSFVQTEGSISSKI